MLLKLIAESARLRLVLLFWVMALHSFVIGLILIFDPADIIGFFGYRSINEQFFPVQGGVFHVLMAVLYSLTALQWEHLKCLVHFSLIVKSSAFVFLFSYYAFVDRIPVIIVLGVCDFGMAVLIALSAKSLKGEMIKKLVTVPGEAVGNPYNRGEEKKCRRENGMSLKTTLNLGFVALILVISALFVIIGIRLVGDTIIKQAYDKVRLDLNSSREVFHQERRRIENVVRLTAVRFFLKDAVLSKNRDIINRELEKIRQDERLDLLTFVERRPGNTFSPLINRVIEKKTAVSAARIISRPELEREGKYLPHHSVTNNAVLAIEAAAPVLDYKNRLAGILCGKKILNESCDIVDKVKDIVYKNKKYKGKDIGTATIFQDGVRISTNVMDSRGRRALGTKVSKEVYDHVIKKGRTWVGRAYVVNNWNISAYEPIYDFDGKTIGMIYVGFLEKPYTDMRERVVLTFVGIAVVSVIPFLFIAGLITGKTIKPLGDLLTATRKVAGGDLEYQVPVTSPNEIGQLAVSFNHMTAALRKTTANYQDLNRTLEDKIHEKTRALENAQRQLIQTEKLTSLGKLAAGVAHEINTPLTTILLNSHFIEENTRGDKAFKFAENTDLIIGEAERCRSIVKGLLEFSRQSSPRRKGENINEILEKTLKLVKNHRLMAAVAVKKDLRDHPPKIMIHAGKIEQVFTNIILNALEAMPEGGELSICSRLSTDEKKMDVIFRDNGRGIPADSIKKIFDPFYTTKGMGNTGLGLSISYGIIKQHGGTIFVESEEKKGTAVTVSLPTIIKKKKRRIK